MITYTICGSMKFAEEMKKIAYQLEIEQGYNILQCVYVEDITKLSEDNIKRLEQAHYKKLILVMEYMLLILMDILENP